MDKSLRQQSYPLPTPGDPGYDGSETAYLHAVLAQVGLPRRRLAARTFTRRTGNAVLHVEAGSLVAPDGSVIEQPLPCGPKARAVLMYLCTSAVLNRNPVISLGAGITSFARLLGYSSQGGERGPLTALREQICALAACHLLVGITDGQSAHNIKIDPIGQLAAWAAAGERRLWPNEIVFSGEFYQVLLNHAVPFPFAAVRALSRSALALDLYTWLSYRFFTLRKHVVVPWPSLRQQFGQEYADHDSFHADVVKQLKRVLNVYPAARVRPVPGGILLKPSPPPVCPSKGRLA